MEQQFFISKFVLRTFFCSTESEFSSENQKYYDIRDIYRQERYQSNLLKIRSKIENSRNYINISD